MGGDKKFVTHLADVVCCLLKQDALPTHEYL